MPMSESAKDSNSDEWGMRTARILGDGYLRDNEAAERDWMASKRDMAANMEAWLTGEADHAAAQARQEAWND
jgi:hypothetical protein